MVLRTTERCYASQVRRAAATLLFLVPLVVTAAPGMSAAIELLAGEHEPHPDEAATHFCDGHCHSTPQVDGATPTLAPIVASLVPPASLGDGRFVSPLLVECAGVRRLVERPPAI